VGDELKVETVNSPQTEEKLEPTAPQKLDPVEEDIKTEGSEDNEENSPKKDSSDVSHSAGEKEESHENHENEKSSPEVEAAPKKDEMVEQSNQDEILDKSVQGGWDCCGVTVCVV